MYDSSECGRGSFNFEAEEVDGCSAVFLYCYCSTVVCDVTVAVVLDWEHAVVQLIEALRY